jgi:hypothetical protein
MHCRTLLLAAVLLTAVPVVLAAGTAAETATVTVERPWARASAGPADHGVAYLTLKNGGDSSDRLVGAASPRAGRVEIHTHGVAGGVMRMRQVAAVALMPGATAVFEPGALHLMLFDLGQPLREGERFPLTLTFEHRGAVTVEVPVGPPGARGPGPDAGS